MFAHSSTHLNAPFKNPDDDELIEIEVTDPAHPLFGRRFHLLPYHGPLHEATHVRVLYRDGIHLRIPARATTLAPARPPRQSKLSLEPIIDLLTVAEDCEALCLLLQPTSGVSSRPNSKPSSVSTSQPSSRR